jgi:hypothetical protein
MEYRRDLTPEDLARLAEAPKVGVPLIQRLRATHHRQAQLLAQGKSVGEVAAIVGCTPQRLTQLQADPTFAELVTYYHDQTMAAMLQDGARLQDKIVDVGEMAVDELRDRLENEEARKRMPVGEIRKIAEFAMDRTVAPPKAAPNVSAPPANVTINFGTTLRPPMELRDSSDIIDGKAEDAPGAPAPKIEAEPKPSPMDEE